MVALDKILAGAVSLQIIVIVMDEREEFHALVSWCLDAAFAARREMRDV